MVKTGVKKYDSLPKSLDGFNLEGTKADYLIIEKARTAINKGLDALQNLNKKTLDSAVKENSTRR